MSAEITITNASLRFRIYRNPSPGLKETVVGQFSKIRQAQLVTEFDALKNISLSVKGGDRLGVIGLNGAGKSTLLKMIVGIYPPHSGHIHVQGKITPMIELGTGFDHELSGRENIYLNGALLGRSYKQMRQLESEIIAFSELGEMIDLPIKYYSSGMHGRLAFSIGAIVDPEILLMDEIFAAGDAHFVQKATARLMELFNNSQIVILVSHDLEQIEELCTRVMVLHKGVIMNEGDPEEMVKYYLKEIVHLDPDKHTSKSAGLAPANSAAAVH
jgi:ABC-type polysaccharide/polyol phosphate transport system ATPase subunit